MTTATLEKCDICGKACKSVKRHKAASHPEPGGIEGGGPVGNEKTPPPALESAIAVQEQLKAKIVELETQLAEAGKVNKSVEDIAKILYEDVARGICDNHGISLGAWEEIDQNDYLKVARKIKG